MNKKSTIAKLLANEDIHVISKPMETAYFNVKTRELGLPVWKDDITKEEEELMVCHEIGHALWTSLDLLIDSRTRELNKSIVNVLEDARIEKFVKSKYPGSVNLFNKGYAALMDRDFFGIGDTDPQKQNLIDRINLYFKGMTNVTFTDDESVFVKRTAGLRTEAEVLDLAADITQHMKDNPEQDDDESDDSDGSDGSQESMTDTHGESGDESGESNDGSGNESGESSDKSDESGNESSESGNKSGSTTSDNNGSGGNSDVDQDPESKTDKAANESVKDLADLDATEKVYARIPKIDSDKMIVDYKTIVDELSEHYDHSPRTNWIQYSLDEIRAFKNDSKKSVAYMVKEFEMKKAADLYARAATSKTGTLDMSALHTYKFNDDLFRKVTTLPGATNHGMIMVLDWSGSMSENLVNTFHQLMQLVWFCRRTQVPFEVFAFTNSYVGKGFLDTDDDPAIIEPKNGEIVLNEDTRLLNFFSSRMNAADEEKMMHYVWMTIKEMTRPFFEEWSITGYPVAYMVKEFEMKKAADLYARAATSKTGTLDMSALHTYKFNDDLFRKVTTLPGATNHGMIMVLDWSGSMSENLVNTFHQLMQLVWFCRRTQVPFEVFAFTNSYVGKGFLDTDDDPAIIEPKNGEIVLNEDTRLLNFFSSRMNAADEEKMMHYVWMTIKEMTRPFFEEWSITGYPAPYCRKYTLSSTPLNESIIAMMDYAPKFKKRTGVQKLNTVFLTDGDSDGNRGVWEQYEHTSGGSWNGTDQLRHRRWGKENLVIDPVTNKQYDITAGNAFSFYGGRELTILLLKALKNRVLDMNVLGFFIAGRGRAGKIGWDTWTAILGTYSSNVIENTKKVMKRDGAVVVPNVQGYDEYYVLPGGRQLAIENDSGLDDELVGASKAKLKTAFGKASKKRAHSRVLLNKFTAKVA